MHVIGESVIWARTSNFIVLSKNPPLGTRDLSGALLRPDTQPLWRGLAAQLWQQR